jgi:DNA-binding SARP family transcriptional activator/predicted ATPase
MEEPKLRFLGEFTVDRAGEQVQSFKTDKDRALLAYLAVETGHPHRRESLAGMFWPDKPEKLARHSLSQALFSLRKIFQVELDINLFNTTQKEIFFQLEACWLDTKAFTELIQSCEEHGHDPKFACQFCTEKLEKAAALYRGDFIAGLTLGGCPAFDEWTLIHRESYQQKMIQIVTRLSHYHQHFGNFEDALDYAKRWVAVDPLDERAHRQAMHLLSLQGRQTAALEQYDACRDVLHQELGVEPTQATIALHNEIMENPQGFEMPQAVNNNLPASLTRCVGRQVELEKLCVKLADPTCRLLTLLGPGGIGKTRLALEAGRSILPVFPDGVFLVGLDTRRPHQSLGPIIAQEVGLGLHRGGTITNLPGTRSITNQLCSVLQNQKVLLILDGFEGMLQEVGLILKILRRAAEAKILITSRARLDLNGEHIFILEGLRYPSQDTNNGLGDYGAIKLFVDAAQRVHPDFELSGDNQAAVVDICRHVQGMPLGILLAAAWAGTLKPVQILKEIQQNLDFLSVEWLNLPDRQRSLRTTFDYSWSLLNETERKVFLRLSVFHGPFTAERAVQVAGAIPKNLRRLREKSFLQKVDPDAYRIHDLLRGYSLEKLVASHDEYMALHKSHCQVYLSALATWEPLLKSPAQLDVLTEINQEYDDILSAWYWAGEYGFINWMENAYEALRYYFELRGLFREGVSLSQRTTDQLEKEGLSEKNIRLWIMLEIWQAQFYTILLLHEKSKIMIQQVREKMIQAEQFHLDTLHQRARLSFVEGFSILWSDSDRRQALGFFQRALQLMYENKQAWDISLALEGMASCHDQLGNILLGQRFAEEGLAIQHEVGDPEISNRLTKTLGYSRMLAGDYESGLRLVKEQNALRQQTNDRRYQVELQTELGLALHHAGQFEESNSLYEEVIAYYTQPEDLSVRNLCKYIMSANYLLMGYYVAVLNDEAWLGEPISDHYRAHLDHLKGWVHLLDPQVIDSTDRENVINYDLAKQEINSFLECVSALPRLDMLGHPLALLGYIAYRRGNMASALEYLIKALENGIRQGYYLANLTILAILALILAEHGKCEQAEEIYTIASSHPMIKNSQLFEDLFGKRIADLVCSLPSDRLDAAQVRGRTKDAISTNQTYLDLLRSGGWDQILGSS